MGPGRVRGVGWDRLGSVGIGWDLLGFFKQMLMHMHAHTYRCMYSPDEFFELMLMRLVPPLLMELEREVIL